MATVVIFSCIMTFFVFVLPVDPIIIFKTFMIILIFINLLIVGIEIKRDTCMSYKKQKYTFLLHLTLQDSKECDLLFYSNYPYKSLKQLLLYRRIKFLFKFRGMDIRKGFHEGFEKFMKESSFSEPIGLEVFNHDEKVCIMSDCISSATFEKFENRPELSDSFNDKLEEVRGLSNQPKIE